MAVKVFFNDRKIEKLPNLLEKYGDHHNILDKHGFGKESFYGVPCYVILCFCMVWYGMYGML